jgi:hypothetical protein
MLREFLSTDAKEAEVNIIKNKILAIKAKHAECNFALSSIYYSPLF